MQIYKISAIPFCMKRIKKYSSFYLTNPPGGPSLPLSQSSRLVIFSCWLVTVVILNTYNANLTSFLAIHERKMPFDNLEGALQTDIEFYTYEGGSARNLLQVCWTASQPFSDRKNISLRFMLYGFKFNLFWTYYPVFINPSSQIPSFHRIWTTLPLT